ncbi:hypothetical protein LguiB_027542 [Lonicera macranthoides]
MPSWSSLRRSSRPIHRFQILLRPFSAVSQCPPPPSPPPPPFIAPNCDSNFQKSPNNNYNPLLGWVSGIVTGSTLALSLYWLSSTSSFASMKSNLWTTEAAAEQEEIHPSNPKFLFRNAYRRKIFFNYEKRIRVQSTPEKVFEYFASFKNTEGKNLMTPADLMRAVVPVFPPSESNLVRDGYLRGERSPGELRCSNSEFFMLFDVNNDGLISFKEYIFLFTLLSIPESSFSVAFKMFDEDNDGEIDREEFKKVMALMRAQNRQGAQNRDGRRAGTRIGGDVENGGLVEYFFGKDGTTRLHHDKFVQFLRDLHDEMIKLEFSHYDYKLRGTISAKDFALSMVASADTRHLNNLLDRVDDLDREPHLVDIRITFEEFKNFAELRKRLQPFSVALLSYGRVNRTLTKKDFQRAASQVCGISLTDDVLEVIFHVFDEDQNGRLCADEFVKVLHKRERDITQPMHDRIMDF